MKRIAPGRLRLLVLTAASLTTACSVAGDREVEAEEGATTVILVRHAEKLDGEDPGLSEAGIERAAALAHALSSLPVDAIYTSQFNRTRNTAIPLAEARGITAEVVDARDPEALLTRIREGDARTIVVVGHSNTVPELARALGAPGVEDIPEHMYDDMLVVRLSGDATADLTHLKYGAPTPR